MSSLLKMMFSCYVIFLLFRTVALQQEDSCTVIKSEPEARMCLNLTDDNTAAPLPINFTTNIASGNFVCNETKPYFYAFFCNLYSTDLIWYYNDQVVNSFQVNDTVGTTYQKTYPEPPDKPVHNITTKLTALDRDGGEEFNISVPYCISTMTIQAFDDDDFEVIPFTVSCRTHCSDTNNTSICQTQNFSVAAKPEKPVGLVQKTIRIAANQGIQIPSAVASINWNTSNDTGTTVVSYNLTLINTNTSDTLYMSLHNTSFTEVVSDGSYNVSISAIDLCGQQSEPATLEFRVDAANLTAPCNEEQLKKTVDGLAAAFAPFTAALIVVIIVLSACLAYQCGKSATSNDVIGRNINYGTSQ